MVHERAALLHFEMRLCADGLPCYDEDITFESIECAVVLYIISSFPRTIFGVVTTYTHDPSRLRYCMILYNIVRS